MTSPREIDLDAYFTRIGYSGPARPTLEALREIHARHVEAIPFESLGAFLNEPVRLDPESLQRKLLAPGRGGWCFEHNLLLADVLQSMGYDVRRLAARVCWNVPPERATPRSHMLLRVRIAGEDYIADAGFGGLTLTAPLALVTHVEQSTRLEAHRLLPHGDGYALQAKLGGEWSTMYVFDLYEHQPVDYEASNWYLATWPQSQFVTGLIAARVEGERRHALRNTRYTIHHRDGRSERRFLDAPAQFRTLLREAFHVELREDAGIDRKLEALIAANPPEPSASTAATAVRS